MGPRRRRIANKALRTNGIKSHVIFSCNLGDCIIIIIMLCRRWRRGGLVQKVVNVYLFSVIVD
jgi:hypothetical protein